MSLKKKSLLIIAGWLIDLLTVYATGCSMACNDTTPVREGEGKSSTAIGLCENVHV